MHRLGCCLWLVVSRSKWTCVGRFTHIVVYLRGTSLRPSLVVVQISPLLLHILYLLIITRPFPLTEFVCTLFHRFVVFWVTPLHDTSLWLPSEIHTCRGFWVNAILLQLSFSSTIEKVWEISHSFRFICRFGLCEAVLLFVAGRTLFFWFLGALALSLRGRFGSLVEDLFGILASWNVQVAEALVFRHGREVNEIVGLAHVVEAILAADQTGGRLLRPSPLAELELLLSLGLAVLRGGRARIRNAAGRRNHHISLELGVLRTLETRPLRAVLGAHALLTLLHNSWRLITESLPLIGSIHYHIPLWPMSRIRMKFLGWLSNIMTFLGLSKSLDLELVLSRRKWVFAAS